MNQTTAKTVILDLWMTLPEHRRRTEQDAAGFVLRLLVEQPELARIPAVDKPYQLIKSWLCESLTSNRRFAC